MSDTVQKIPAINELNEKGETALISTIKKGDIDEIRSLIQAGADVNKADINTETPLHWAVYSENLEIAKLLLDYKANVNAQNCKRYTPVFYALFTNNMEMIKLFYAHGADLHVNAFFDGTLLHFAANSSTKEIVEFCIEHNFNMNALSVNKETPLAWAMYGNKSEFIEILTKNGALIKGVFDIWGNSIIDAAILENNSTSVQTLISYGANILDKNPVGRSALHTSVSPANERINIAMVELLLEMGADVNAIQDDGTSVLMWAVKYSSLEIVKLLLDNGAKIDPIKESKTIKNSVIHNALSSANKEIAELIISKARNINFKDKSGKTPLIIAAEKGLTTCVKTLLQKDADITIKDDFFGMSALHAAAIHGYEDIVQELIKDGANIDDKDLKGKTALEYAAQYGYTNLEQELLKAHKNISQIHLVQKNTDLCKEVKLGSAIIWYLGHSGWAVKTENNFLIFDYSDMSRIPNDASIINGHIVSDEIKNLNVTVFVSNIPLEHWNPQIFSWKETVKNCNYVYGFKGNKIKPYTGPEYTQINVNTTKEINGIEVTTLLSNAGGAGYLITVDGITLYHAGDHAERTQDGTGPYRSEIDLLAKKNKNIHFAFLPIEGDYLGKSEIIELGNDYTISTLKPHTVIPMHCGGNEKSYALYCKRAQGKHLKAKFIAARNRGDSYEYSKQ